MTGTVAAYVGLGSNLDNPVRQVRSALRELGEIPHTCLGAASPLYTSRPLGPQDQPDYINAVARLDTELDAPGLFAALLAIERRHGRQRDGRRWVARTLDLDLLLYGDACLNGPELIVPHPGMHERAFVLYPLADIAPELIVPGHGPIRDLLARCTDPSLTRLESDRNE